MSFKEKVPDMLVGVAVVGALVSAFGIAVSIGGLLLSDNHLLAIGLAMIGGGTATYVATLSKVQRDQS
jgi:hypothetical protein